MDDEPRLSPLFTWRSAVSSEDGPESSTTRHVLLALSLYMNQKGGSCFPSTRTLADETGLSRRTVEEHLRRAADNGWIKKTPPRRAEDGTYEPAEYTASVPGEPLSPGPGESDTRPGESDNIDQGKQLPHSTSVQRKRQKEDVHHQRAPARERLRKWLNGHSDVLTDFASAFDGRWAAAIWGQYVSGTRSGVWNGLPEKERPPVLATTMWAYIGDAPEYDNRLFDKYLERVVREWKDDRNDAAGLTEGDRQIIDFRERIEHVDLGGDL